MERGARSPRIFQSDGPADLKPAGEKKIEPSHCLASLYAAITQAFRRGAHLSATRHTELLRKSGKNRSCRESSDAPQAQLQLRRLRSRGPKEIRALPSWLASAPRSNT